MEKNPEDVVRELRKLRAEFRAIHHDGMTALRAGDYDTVERVILRERQIFTRQAQLMKERVARARQVVARPRRRRG